MYFVMLKEAEENNADIVQCGYFKVDNMGKTLEERNFVDSIEEVKGSYNCSFEYAKRKIVDPFLCTKIFKKELFDGVSIPGLFFAEDQCALIKLFNNCEKLRILPQVFYYYVMNPDSLYHSKFNIKKLDGIKAGKMMYAYQAERFLDLAPFYSERTCYYIVKFYAPLKRSKIEGKKELLNKMSYDFIHHYNKIKNSSALVYLPKKGRYYSNYVDSIYQ